MSRTKFVRRLVAVAASALMGGAMIAMTAAPASADYGKGAQYQIELSVNIPGRDGGGVWLWIGLNKDGSADWAGSDCGHGGVGAASDVGDGTWHYTDSSHDWIQIADVPLHGLPNALPPTGPYLTTITIPSARGHYTGTDTTFMTLPDFLVPQDVGFTQLQVATIPPNFPTS